MITHNIIEDERDVRSRGRRKTAAVPTPLKTVVEIVDESSMASEEKKRSAEEDFSRLEPKNYISSSQKPSGIRMRTSDKDFHQLGTYVDSLATEQKKKQDEVQLLEEGKGLDYSCKKNVGKDLEQTVETEVEKSGKKSDGKNSSGKYGENELVTKSLGIEQKQVVDGENELDRSGERNVEVVGTEADLKRSGDEGDDVAMSKGSSVSELASEMSKTSQLLQSADDGNGVEVRSARDASADAATTDAGDDDKSPVAEVEGGTGASRGSETETETAEMSNISQTSAGQLASPSVSVTDRPASTVNDQVDSSSGGDVDRLRSELQLYRNEQEKVEKYISDDVIPLNSDTTQQRRKLFTRNSRFIVPIKRRSAATKPED